MTLPVVPVPEIVIIWKCSVPDTTPSASVGCAPVGAAEAVVTPETVLAASVTTAPALPIRRLWCFSIGNSSAVVADGLLLPGPGNGSGVPMHHDAMAACPARERGNPHGLTGAARPGPVGRSAARAYSAGMRAGIFGRDAELRALDAFLEGLSSAPSAVVLAGGAGAGKTTLLRAGMERAAGLGYTVLRTLPSQSDMRLAFAGLADLLDAHLDVILPRLQGPQRRALGVALLVEDAPQAPPEPRVIAAAFRSALLVLAESAPVIVVADDIQWLDAPTASAASFALRRR